MKFFGFLALAATALCGCPSDDAGDDGGDGGAGSPDGGSGSPDGASRAATFDWAEIAVGANITVSHIAADSSGVVVAGALLGSATIAGKTFKATDTSNGNAFLVKYSPSGEALWALIDTNDSKEGPSSFETVTVDSSGDILVGAFFNAAITLDGTTVAAPSGVSIGPLSEQTDSLGAAVVKISSDGTSVLWAQPIQTTEYVYANAIGVDGSGNVVVGGSMSGTSDFSQGKETVNIPGTSDGGFYLAGYDSSGTIQWAEQAPGVPLGNRLANESAIPIAVESSGSFYLGVGEPSVSSGGAANLTGDQILILKYASDGSLTWTEKATGSGGTSFLVTGLTFDPIGNLVVAGTIGASVLGEGGTQKATFGTTNLTGKSGFAAEYSTSGSLLWATTIDNTTVLLGGNGSLFPAVSGSSVYIFGNNDSADDGQVFVIDDKTGATVPGTPIVAASPTVLGVAAAASGTDVYIAGQAQEPVTFGKIQVPGSKNGMFVAKVAN
jgi:hypothetical protein